MNSLYIILTASLVAIPCAILGSFLILRRTVMIGDAISHAVLPGIVITYMMTQSLDSIAMLFGASAIGLLTTLLVEFFSKKGGLQEDAAIGVTFTWLFAIGVILISVYTNADLDQECVLYGKIDHVALDLWIIGDGYTLGPKALWFLFFVTLVVVLFVWLGFKKLFITTFDPAFAGAIGISIAFWHYALMSLVSFTTVASFHSVGAILVIAFLVIPSATAYLLTDNLVKMIVLSCFFGILSALIGTFISGKIAGLSTTGTISTCALLFFLLTLVASPKHGIFKHLFQKA